MIIVINYADQKFRKSQKYNTYTALKKGKADKVIEYSPHDIDENFLEKYSDILKEKRGAGYWLWKPYILHKTINKMNEGDYLFYCDSGAHFINKIEYLINELESSKQDVMIFDLPLVELQWTNPQLFINMDLDSESIKESNQRLATYILFKVSVKSKIFIEEYLSLCCEKENLLDAKEKITNSERFIAHRHDQSILSLLSKKYGYCGFRDPSQYGIRPWEYRANNREFLKIKHTNSNYPQIIVSQRNSNPFFFGIKDYIKSKLTTIGILNEKQFIKKNNINI